MSHIIFVPSMALDALCFLQNHTMPDRAYMSASCVAIMEEMIVRLPADFPDYPISMSSLSMIVGLYTRNQGLETMTLDELADLFEQSALYDTVEARLRNGFQRSHMIPLLNYLRSEWGIKTAALLRTLRDCGFEALYREKVLPPVQNYAALCQRLTDQHNPDLLFSLIERVKPCKLGDNIRIFVSLFSEPICFSLSESAYLTHLTREDYIAAHSDCYLRLSAHELMHGFADDGLISRYRAYVDCDPFLRENHRKLLEEMQEGDEEEFVLALEYALRERAGLASRQELLREVKKAYSGICPTAAFLYDLLSREQALPAPCTPFLYRVFDEGLLPTTDIEQKFHALS